MFEILCQCNGDIPGVSEGDLPAHSHRIRTEYRCLETDHPTMAYGDPLVFVLGHEQKCDPARWEFVSSEAVMLFSVPWKRVARALMTDRAG